ncbi:CBS domain-containing protein [Streptomyces sp. WMMB303]|uniref:CBS domain-containing protein n=1 Tax=Streptomyces sp. WMMB303 TaxID=3034154 RepID=UPI003208DC1A
MRHRTVRDLMTRPAVCVNPGTGLKETARLMAEHDISAVPVVDENEKPVGMVSEGVVRVRGRIGAHDSPELLERLCRAVDGVVDVRLDLGGPEQAPAAA